MKSSQKLPDNALIYVLKGLIPYSRANLALTFKPSKFIYDLELIAHKKHSSLRNAYYQAKRTGLIATDDKGSIQLTEKGRQKIVPYEPKILDSGARLLVIFDIAEEERWKRRKLRTLLNELAFEQIQKSVWSSPNDHRDLLKAAIQDMDLAGCVIIYEALALNVD